LVGVEGPKVRAMSTGRGGTSSPAGGMGLSRIGTTTSGGGGGGQTHRTAFGEKAVGSSQDELMENVVKIGDIVILSTEECGARWNGGDSRGGRLEADGFADGGCWVRESAEGGGNTFIDSLYRVKTKQVWPTSLSNRRNLSPLVLKCLPEKGVRTGVARCPPHSALRS
jgi:hypothetical protein